MNVAVFLFGVLVLLLILVAFEVRAWLRDPEHYITTLSRKNPILRWLIELAILLALIWWPWHVETGL